MEKIMFKKLTVLSICAMAICLNAQTLKQSVEKTLEKNPEVLAEEFQKSAYRYYIDEQEGDYLPQIDLNAYAESSKTELSPDNANSSDSEKDGFNASIRLQQLIYDGGKTPAEIRKAKAQSNEQKYKSNQNIETVVLGVTRAYSELVQYNELMALTKGIIKTNEENLEIAKEKEDISGEILETYQVTSKLNLVQEQFYEEESNKEERLSKLKRYTLESATTPVCRPNVDANRLDQPLNELIQVALKNNYKILEAIEDVKEKRESIAISDASFLPSLNLVLQGSIDEDLSLSENGKTEEILGRINLSWNLYNGGTDSATNEKEKLFLEEAKSH